MQLLLDYIITQHVFYDLSSPVSRHQSSKFVRVCIPKITGAEKNAAQKY